MIPNHLQASLDDYANHGVPVGGFLSAVLANDLMLAVGRADDTNVRILKEICEYVFNFLPRQCYGSREAVEGWIKHKRPKVEVSSR